MRPSKQVSQQPKVPGPKASKRTAVKRETRIAATDMVMSDYVKLVTNPCDTLSESNIQPVRHPCSAGTTTFACANKRELDIVADAPYYDSAGLKAGVSSFLIVATNSPSETRILRTRGSGVTDGLVVLDGDLVVNVTNTGATLVGGGADTSVSNPVLGIISSGNVNDTNENYHVAIPKIYGKPGWLMTWASLDSTNTLTFRIKSLYYRGNVAIRLRTCTSLGVWTNRGVVNMQGSTSSYLTINFDTGLVEDLYAIGLDACSNVEQELNFQATLYVPDNTCSFGCPRHMNLLTPDVSLFQTEIGGGLIREYWTNGAGEILSNKTNDYEKEGMIYAVSTQRFAGIFNEDAQDDMVTTITSNKIHYKALPAKDGASGHMLPRALEPIPSKYSAMGFGSDCRMYLVISETVQKFNLTYSTWLTAIGKRTSTTNYGLANFPSYWFEVCRAVSLVNPIDCNPEHPSQTKRALEYIRQWVSVPANQDKLRKGLVTGVDLAAQALSLIAPRIGNALGMARSLF